jgi:protein gp37
VWIGTSIEDDSHCWRADELRTIPAAIRFLSREPLLGPLASLGLAGIGWVIVGGESGPDHRPMDLDWARDIRDRCVRHGIPLFFKQMGGSTPKAGGRHLDGRTGTNTPPRRLTRKAVRRCQLPVIV